MSGQSQIYTGVLTVQVKTLSRALTYVVQLKHKVSVLSTEDEIRIVEMLDEPVIDFVGVAWVWSTLSELLAYLNGSNFSLVKGVPIIDVGLYYTT